MKGSKVYEKLYYNTTRDENISAAMDYTVILRAWQRYYKLCFGNLVLYTGRFCSNNRTFNGKFICAICAVEHFCWCIKRPLEQENYNASM